jgi:DNA-binding transcriptional ArsR family regulator
MNIQGVKAKAGEAATLLKLMANDHRLVVLCELAEGERTVSDLAAATELGQSALSQHLARLRRAGVVTTRRQAQTIHYALAGSGVARMISVLSDIYCRPPRGRRVS